MIAQSLVLLVELRDGLRIGWGVLWFPLYQWRLRRHGLNSCYPGGVSSVAAVVDVSPSVMSRALRISRVVNKISALCPWHVSCLDRSLLLLRLLQGNGIPGQLRVGVQPPSAAGQFVAHAWVELGGAVINDEVERISQFRPFPAVDGS